MFVHNLSAVGEQYLDFEPPDDQGPYARSGDTFARRRRLAAGRRGRPAGRARPVRRLGRQGEPAQAGRARARDHVRGHRAAAPAAARQRQRVRRRGGGAHGRDHPAARTVASGCCAPSRARARTSARSPATSHALTTVAARRATATCARVLDRHPGRGPRDRRAARGPRADTAGAARQRGQRQPGRGVPPRRASSSCWSPTRASSPAGFTGHPRRRLRPREPAARLPACRRAPRATSRAAEWRPPSDLTDSPIFPARVRQRPAVRACAASKYSPERHRATRLPGRGLPVHLRPADRIRRRCRRRPRRTPYDSSIRATCRSWEGTRGSGCWWVR